MKKLLILFTLLSLVIVQGCSAEDRSVLNATKNNKPTSTKIQNTSTPIGVIEESKSYNQVFGLKSNEILKLEIGLRSGGGWETYSLSKIDIEEVLKHLKNQKYFPCQRPVESGKYLAGDTAIYRLIFTVKNDNDKSFYLDFYHNNAKIVIIDSKFYSLADNNLFKYTKQLYNKLKDS